MTDLETAIELLTCLVDPGECSYSNERPFKGETCGEYLSNRTGGTRTSGCFKCQANELLEKHGYRMNKHGNWEKVDPRVQGT